MSEIKVDRRIRKTKKSIYKAVAELLAKKGVDLITIKEICEIADINRKTFYNYYSTVFDVIDEIENNVLEALLETTADIDFETAMNEPYLIFKQMNEIFMTDLEFYRHLMAINSNFSLISKIESALKEDAKTRLLNELNINPTELEIMLDFAYSGMMNSYQKWFTSAYDMSLEEVSKAISVICFGGIRTMVDKYKN